MTDSTQDNDSVTVNDPFAPENDGAEDPFAPQNIGILQFIMLSRIYDLFMIDLNERRPEVAKQVLELHRRGAILGTAPVLSGQFMADDPTLDDGTSQSDTSG